MARVRVRDHEAISLLMALDDHLYDTLRSGAIKLIISALVVTNAHDRVHARATANVVRVGRLVGRVFAHHHLAVKARRT